jgi:hypothetical protein
MNDRTVERVLDTGTSDLSTNQVIKILLALVLIGREGSVTYTTLTMPTGLATLTWWNTEAGRGFHYPPATTRGSWG